MSSWDVIWVWKASQVAFGCSNVFMSLSVLPGRFESSDCDFDVFGVSLVLLVISLAWVPFGSSGHSLSTAVLTLWSSFWLTLHCLIHIYLLWFCVCICLGHRKIDRWKRFWSGPKLLRRSVSLHTILLLVLEEVKKIGLSFWINSVLFQPRQLVVIQVKNSQLWVGVIFRPDQDRYPKICLKPSLGMILCSLPSLRVSRSVRICLSMDAFSQF